MPDISETYPPNIVNPEIPDPETQNRASEFRYSILVYTILGICILGIGTAIGYRLYMSDTVLTGTAETEVTQEIENTASPSATPRPSPTPIQLHPGPEEYAISHPKSAGPTISKIGFNPLDVHKGETAVISVQLTSNQSVISVKGILESDTSKTELTFTKTSESGKLQTWSTQLTLTDSVWYTYVVSVTATDTAGSTTVTVAPRS